MNDNMRAFLSLIAHSEGTAGIGEDGYNVIVGARKTQPILFGSYHGHPRLLVVVRRDNPRTAVDEGLFSTAAGRYQVLAHIYDHYKLVLRLPDFSPASQDKIALRLISECKAESDIFAGRIEHAIDKCKSRWASFPGAGYGQPEHSFSALRTAFLNLGGTPA